MRIPVALRFLAVALGLMLGCAHSKNPFYSINVTVTPGTVALPASASQLFTAAIQGSTQGVTWAVQEAAGGTITAAGLYTAPAVLGTYHVVATSVENATKAGTAVITVEGAAQITSFTATPTVVASGGTTALQAVFSGGTGTLNPGALLVTSGQPVTVTPDQTTTYILTVASAAGAALNASASVTVTVAPPPVIQSFTASATSVLLGGSVTLTPVFSAGTGDIEPTAGAAVSGTAYTVSPTQTTTYTLTVTGALGAQVTSAVTVTVYPPLQITSFTASPATTLASGNVLLQPVFSGGTGAITPGVGAVTSGQSITVTPTATTTYTLTVTSPTGATLTAAAPVTVALPPVIQSLLASATSLVQGGSLTLTPAFSAGTGAITPAVGPVTSGTAYTVTPAQTTTYLLTVTGATGATVTSALPVTVIPPLQITSFAASPATSYPGASVSLLPVFAGGTGAVTPAVGAVTSGQSVTVTPDTTTTYTLTATDAQGNQMQATTQVLVRAHGSYSAVGPIGTPRKYHTATLLQDGTVLVAGGLPEDDASASFTVLNEAERFNPATGAFSPVGTMAQARTGHAAVLLQNGKVLLTGGNATWAPGLATTPIAATATAELWDPASGQFTLLGAAMTMPRRNHTATLLANGQVLICGGLEGAAASYGDILNTAELFDPVAGTFTATTAPMTVARQAHSAVALQDGTVLLLGGVAYDALLNPYGIPNAEVFTLTGTPPFLAAGSALATGRGQAGVALLPNGQVFVAGGLGPAGTWLQTTELYTPASGTFGLSALMGQAVPYPVGALLANGQVVVIGMGDTEVFNPAGPFFASMPGLGLPALNGLTATPLATTGKVLVVNLEGAKLLDPLNP